MKPRVISRMRHMRFSIAILLTAGVTACSNSPLGPDGGAASMRVSASAVTATSLGQSVAIQAERPMVKVGKMMWKAIVNAN